MRHTLPLLPRLLPALLMLVAGAAQAMMEADKFIGAWRLLSAEFRTETGELAESPYGAEPQGILMYDAQGTMAVQISQSGRKPFAVADRRGGTDAEVRAAFETYQAYAGRFRVDERTHEVIHSVTQSLLPNWIGGEQKRKYEFRDGRLILRAPPLLLGGKRLTAVLVWERIKLRK